MKRKSIILVLVMAALLLLSGCSSNYSFTQTADETKIKISAKKDATGESLWFSVPDGYAVEVTTSLDSGKVQLEFVEVAVSVIDGDEDVTTLDVVKSITVSGSDKVTVELPVNDYVIWVTAVENSKGTIETKVVRK